MNSFTCQKNLGIIRCMEIVDVHSPPVLQYLVSLCFSLPFLPPFHGYFHHQMLIDKHRWGSPESEYLFFHVFVKLFHRIRCMPHSEELLQGKLHARRHHWRDTTHNQHLCFLPLFYFQILDLLLRMPHNGLLSLFLDAQLPQPDDICIYLHSCTWKVEPMWAIKHYMQNK